MRGVRWIASVLTLALLLAGPLACKKDEEQPGAPGETPSAVEVPEAMPPEASELVTAYTAGTISTTGKVTVRFIRPMVADDQLGTPLSPSPFAFEPDIAGSAVFNTTQELEFVPANRLPAGTQYQVSLDVSRWVDELAEGKERLAFSLRTMPQTFEVSEEGLRAVDPDAPERQRFTGSIHTGDVADGAAVEKMVSASHPGSTLELSWTHSGDGRAHKLMVDGIVRQEDGTVLTLTVTGAPIGVDRQETVSVTVPGLNEFKLSHARAVDADERYVELRFSDPLEPNQNLSGLIRVGSRRGLRFVIDGSVARVYSSQRWTGQEEVRIAVGVRNRRGFRLREAATATVSFERMKPQVRFASKGVIVPTTRGLTLPIEAVNLNAVMIEATRVLEQNVPQFLQINDLAGDKELRRVGRVVWRDTVQLDTSGDRDNRWVRYGLDLSQLVAGSPGGMYRLKLTFRRQHIAYECEAGKWPEMPREKTPDDDAWFETSESSSWDYWGGGLSYWQLRRNRNEPCHPGYYSSYSDHDVTVSRNVLVSDVGLVAKRGTDGTLFVVASDLRTAQPLTGIPIEVLDYQQTKIASGTTNDDGTVTLRTPRRPFVVLATHGTQKGFLKLHDGQALAVSHFDVGGATVSQGLKGVLYGERGVWRPGDDIFLTFVLLDEHKRLPATHPVRFELIDSRGRLVDSRTTTDGVDGFYRFTSGTDGEAPTGTYTARALVGGATFTLPIKVETVVPNRLKIEMDVGTELITSADPQIAAKLSATWLHGAIAKNLRAVVEATLSPRRTRFDRYTDYVFDDPSRQFHGESETIFDGRLDEYGATSVSASIKTSAKPAGMLTASFKTRVFEPSGAFSVDRFRVAQSPYPRYVGLKLPKGDKARGMLLTDTPHKARMVLVDETGQPAASGKVACTLYKIKWRWWWEKGDENLAQYRGSRNFRELQSGVADVVDGTAEWEFEVKYPEWGRYLVTCEDQQGGHRTGKIVYIDWPGWAGRAQKDQPGGASVLTFAADRQSYTVGETVTLTVPTAKLGRGLLTLETGSRVLQSRWLQASGDQTQVTFTASAEMSPTVYASVTFVQPHNQADNDLPMRVYGVVPIEVVDPATKLAPTVDCADEFAPMETAEITVAEKQGKAMTYTLAVVDEGLLGLTRFETPSLWDHFYAREALGVKTWDLYDMVAGAYGAALERMLAIGGDGGGPPEPPQSKAKRFPPMIRYLGPFTLAAGDSATHQVDIPQYIGQVRVMVVAGHDGAYGSADKQVFVRKPLMVQGTLPRVLGPEEEVQLPVAVFALDEKVTQVSVRVETEGPVSVAGQASQTVAFDGPGDKMLGFALKVTDAIGVAKVRIIGEGGGERAEHTIEIDVRMPGVRVTDVLAASLAPGESWQQQIALVGVAGTNVGTLEVSRIPPVDLTKRLNWLIRYPHGCVEQTTSSVFPQVHLTSLVDLPDSRKQEISSNIKAGIERLQGFQTASGGFGYWPGHNAAQDWSSSYVGHFLLEAKKAGYVVPAEMLSRWQTFQAQASRSWIASNDGRSGLTQAYRLFTLALAGDAELGAMNRLKESSSLSDAARWRLAAAYQLAGQPETAKALVESASTEVQPYALELSGTFGSSLRDKAMILETLFLMKRESEAAELAREISTDLSGDRGWNTQALAYALVAMSRFGQMVTEDQPTRFSWTVAGEQMRPVQSDKLVVERPLALAPSGRSGISLTNDGKQPLFVRVIVSGVPKPGKEKGREQGLRLRVVYRTTSGSKIDPYRIEQGTDFVAEVTVTNVGTRGRYEEVALSHLVPAGWEIHNERLDPTQFGQRADLDYQDIRDDRVYTYFDLAQGEKRTFKVQLNASYLGRFYLPMIHVETMYDETINGRLPGQWITVVRPGVTG